MRYPDLQLIQGTRHLDADAGYQILDSLLSRLEPTAKLVSGRVVRRLLVRLRDLDGLALLVPHGWGLAVRSRDALHHATAQELMVSGQGQIPEWLLLIARPSPGTIASWSEFELYNWLKGRLVHLAADRAFAQNRPANHEGWLAFGESLDERVWEEVMGVLAEEKRLIPGAKPWEEREEFLSTALELSLVDPDAIQWWFPSVDPKTIDSLLWRHSFLEGPRELALRLDGLRVQVPGSPVTSPCAASQELAARLAARFSTDTLHPLSKDKLARALAPVYRLAGTGAPVARSILEDVRQAVSLAGTALEKVDAFRWLLSLGREPFRRELPYSGWLMAIRSIRAAAVQVGKMGLSAGETRDLLHQLHLCEDGARESIRRLVGPVVESAFRKVGLVPERVLEGLAWRQVVDELLDRLAKRGEIALGDLRDALASHRMKLADLEGPAEWLKGDLLLRADRKLAADLPGAYRPGEIYMRGLQRLSSLFYGNPPGRALFLYLLFPLAIVYVAFKGVQELVNLAMAVTGHKRFLLEVLGEQISGSSWLPLQVELDEKKSELILGNSLAYLGVGAFVSLLIYSPLARKRCARILWKVGVGLHRLLVDLPGLLFKVVRWFIRLPYIRQIYQHGVRPGAEALVAMLVLRYAGWLPPAGDGLWFCVFSALVALFLSSPWRLVEEAFMDMFAWAWNHLGLALILAIFDWIVVFFRWLMEVVSLWLRSLERLLLQPPSGKLSSLVARGLASILISPFIYIIRAVLLIFVEPQVNPVKHFPVVTVGHKLMLTMAPGIASSISASTGKNYLEVLATVTFVLTLIPGFMGFLVWELKENWRLYRANQPRFLRPVLVGGHGESMRGMLAPGFHSGTLPKLYRRLRRGGAVSRAVLSETLGHDFALIRDFFRQELVDVWRLCPAGPEMVLEKLEGGPQRVHARLGIGDLGFLEVTLAWRGWWMEALAHRSDLGPSLNARLDLLVEGLWHKSGALLSRADWERFIPGLVALKSESGVIRVFNKEGHHADYPTDGVGWLRPNRAGWPPVKPREVLVPFRPFSYADWDAAWEKMAVEGTETFAGA